MQENLISKFLSGKRLTNDELNSLDKYFNNIHHKKEIFTWLEANWQQSQNESVALKFEQIREKIRNSVIISVRNRFFIVLVRAAAILFLPLLAAALYLYTSQTVARGMLVLTTQKGEQTSVILPDGSKVWLNVDTKLSYPVDYGVKSRKIEVEGEAYFEVVKNQELPFEVASGNLVTTALGTRFIVSAYPESSKIKSSLIKGSVDVKIGREDELLQPGQQLVYNKNTSSSEINSFDKNLELAWKNDQLIFRLTPFDEVITRLEKWYDINIEYDPLLFNSETLTVQFEEYESLETILKVIAKANGFVYRFEGKDVKIKKLNV